MNHKHDWETIEDYTTMCKVEGCRAEFDDGVIFYTFSLEEVLALKRLLAHHYISYEDMEAINVTRRIMEVEDESGT